MPPSAYHNGTANINTLEWFCARPYLQGMESRDISEEIIEDLYAQALLLADDARACFDLRFRDNDDLGDDLTRVALSIEGLRTTTRVMQVLAWLLNQRAYFEGEMSEGQLRKHSKLPHDRPSTPEDLELLEEPTCDLIEDTIRLHRRIARLDRAWRDGFETAPGVRQMHERIGQALMAQEVQKGRQNSL